MGDEAKHLLAIFVAARSPRIANEQDDMTCPFSQTKALGRWVDLRRYPHRLPVKQQSERKERRFNDSVTNVGGQSCLDLIWLNAAGKVV